MHSMSPVHIARLGRMLLASIAKMLYNTSLASTAAVKFNSEDLWKEFSRLDNLRLRTIVKYGNNDEFILAQEALNNTPNRSK